MTTSLLKHRLTTLVLAACCAVAGCHSAPNDPAKAAKRENAQVRAVDAFEEGAKSPPKTGTLYSLARILMGQGRDAEAMTVLNNLTQRYPDFAPAYNAQAECYLRAERTGEAIDVLKAGLKRLHDDAVLLNNLGMVWFLEGRYEEALKHFDAAAAAEPKEAMYVANQAMTLAMLGREKPAEALYGRVLDYPNLRHNLRILAKARENRAAEGLDETQARTARGDLRDVDPSRAETVRATGIR